jgi:hypothetical protein
MTGLVRFKAMAGPATLTPPTLDGSGGPGIGTVRAVVATLGRVDADGDLTVPGFFGRQDVRMVPTHDWSHVPLGKGVLFEDGDQAVVDLRMNLAVPAARAWWEALAFDLANPPPLQQWSYGYTVKGGGSFEGKASGRPLRFLTPLADGSPGVVVHEVGPVMLGAGVDTATVAVGDSGDPGGLDPAAEAAARELARSIRSGLILEAALAPGPLPSATAPAAGSSRPALALARTLRPSTR